MRRERSAGWRRVASVEKVAVMLRGQSGTYYLWFRDSKNSRTLRRSTGTSNLEEAKAAARKLRDTLKAGKKHAAATLATRDEKITVEAALDEAARRGGFRNRKKSDEHVAAMNRFAGYFLEWLGSRARYWEQIKPRLVMDYIEYLDAQGLKPKSIRHYVAPLIGAGRYWAAVDCDRYTALVVSHPALDLGVVEKKFLTLNQLFVAIAKADEMQERAALIGFVLGGLAGARLREVSRITRKDFDVKSGMLTLTPGGGTKGGPRTIPLLPEVSELLKVCFEQDPNDFLVHWEDGRPGNNDTVARPMRRVLDACDFGDIPPKDAARKSFMNWARMVEGVDPSALTSYVGHRPVGMADHAYIEWRGVQPLLDRVVLPLIAHLESLRQQSAGKGPRVVALSVG